MDSHENFMITGARAPVALHLARLFHQAGHKIILADSQRFPLARATRLKHAYVRLPPPRNNMAAYAQAVETAVSQYNCDLVIPTCEEMFLPCRRPRPARQIYPACSHRLSPRWPAPMTKASSPSSAIGLGADPPPSDVVTFAGRHCWRLETAASAVLKPVWSRFASRVLVQPTAAELNTVKPTAADPWVVQDYLPGEEICAYAVAFNGRLCAFAAYRPLYRAGRGAGIAFEPVTDAAALAFRHRLCHSHPMDRPALLRFPARRGGYPPRHRM